MNLEDIKATNSYEKLYTEMSIRLREVKKYLNNVKLTEDQREDLNRLFKGMGRPFAKEPDAAY